MTTHAPFVSLGEQVTATSHHFADLVSVVAPDVRLTFAEVESLSNRLANWLGVQAPVGSRVAVLLDNSAEFVVSDLAIAKSGMVKVPINLRLAESERRYIIDNSRAAVVIARPDAASAATGVATVVELLELSDFAALQEAMRTLDDTAPERSVEPEDAAVILYTSGTTGRPKGAMLSQRSRLAATTSMLINELDVAAGDGMIHAGSLAHGSGSKVAAFYLKGARNIVVPGFDPESFIETLGSEAVTATFLVPTMISRLLEIPFTRSDVATLKTLSYGGEPASPDLLRRALSRFGPVLVQVYGSCEAPHPVTVLSKDDHLAGLDERPELLSSAGRPAIGNMVRIVNDEGSCAAGETGEMWLRGACLMSGYWDNPEATAEVLDGGWYRSGDLGRMSSDGYVTIVGRSRDLVISGGLNIYPAEVEAVLSDHPDIAEVAVIGIPDADWGEALVAFVVPASGSSLDASAVVRHASEHLAGYKKPRHVRFVESLPKGSTGKILKSDLAKLVATVP